VKARLKSEGRGGRRGGVGRRHLKRGVLVELNRW
jgi:hypothetical protein